MDASVPELRRQALRIRRYILRLIKAGKAGHVGGALSAADLTAALFFAVMRMRPEQPDWPDRDRFVLSAGHKAMLLYAALAARGFIKEDVLDTYGSFGCALPGHPDMHKLPGVEASTGALGHGLPLSVGMALGLRMASRPSRVFALMGDGEQAEGSIWEAAAAASHHKLSNLVGIVDCNGLQISGPTAEVMSYEPLHERWRAFGWEVRRIDGHDLPLILRTLAAVPFHPDRPSLIVADTIKSRGVPSMEGKVEHHYWKPPAAELARAEQELEAAAEVPT